MAGIGFILRDLNRRGNLISMARAYGHGMLVSAGPWVFTILCLSGINLFGVAYSGPGELALTRIIIIYNFAFSLIISGPLVMTNTRYLADRIFVKEVREVPGMLLGSLVLVFALEAVIGIPFYGFIADLEPVVRVLAVINLFAAGGVWAAMIFLTTLKNFSAVTSSFFFGMVLGLVTAIAGADAGLGVAGLLGGFTIGLLAVLYMLISEIFIEYPYPVQNPFRFMNYLKRYWELALCGFLYNLAIWIDKFVMWTAPQHTVLAGVMVSYPAYDGAMFMAYLCIIPGMTLFLVSAETRFYEEYARFYREIREKANYTDIKANQQRLTGALNEIIREVTMLQAIVCTVVILIAYQVIALTSNDYNQLGMFRFGVLGVLFHGLLLFTSIIVIYFDLRRMLLVIFGVFLGTNTLFSFISLYAGFNYYGYGYFAATLVSFVVAYAILMSHVRKLPFLTFVGNNQSVKLSRPITLPVLSKAES